MKIMTRNPNLEEDDEWCFRFLLEVSKYPFSGSFSIGELERIYTQWKSADSNIGGMEAAEHHSYETLLNKNAFAENAPTEILAMFDSKSKLWKREHRTLVSKINQPEPDDFRKISHRTWPPEINRIFVRGALEADEEIIAEGSKRGRKYRHNMARPSMGDAIVAEIMENILRTSDKDELKMEEIRKITVPIIKSIHAKCEEEVSESDRGLHITIGDIRAEIPQGMFNEDAPDDYVVVSFPPGCMTEEGVPDQVNFWRYKKRFASDLEHWSELCYDEAWFKGSIANIQRMLKIAGKAAPGSKRGLWVHAEKVHKISTKSSSILSTSSKIRRVEDEIKEGIFVNSKDINYLSMLKIVLAENLDQVSSMIREIKDTEAKRPSMEPSARKLDIDESSFKSLQEAMENMQKQLQELSSDKPFFYTEEQTNN